MIARHLLGEPERRDRLEQREQRPAKQPGLLSRDDGDGRGVGQCLAGFDGTRRGAAEPLLRADDRRNLGRRRLCVCARAIACAHAARSDGSPEKNGATAEKSYA